MMKYLNLVVVMLLFAAFTTTAVAQDGKLKKANDLFMKFNYPDAAEMYKKILADNPDAAEAKINLAESYRFMNQPVEAEYWYEQVVQLPEAEPIHTYYYGMALKANGKFEQARQAFMDYARLVPADSRGLRQVEATDQANYYLTDPGIYQISITNINTDIADFGPAFFDEGIVWASESGVKSTDGLYDWRDQPYLDLFYAKREGNNPSQLGEKKLFGGKGNTQYHEGTLTFTQDGSKVYFSRDQYYKGNLEIDRDEEIPTVHLNIYEADVNGTDFENIKPLPFNSTDYSLSHPALSPDGQALYFVSDMAGGFGETDIYVSYKSGDSWGQPENIGAEINTEGREMFVFMAEDETLYFSSDALPGLGGLDVFSTKLQEDGTWSAPENLRYPINTNADDFGFIIDDEGEIGYFSSNRSGGQGDDDIYSFTKLTNVMTGIVVDCNTQQPIVGADVRLVEHGRVMQKRRTKEGGIFTFPIQPSTNYIVEASKSQYQNGEQQVSTMGANGTQIQVKIPLCPEGQDANVVPGGPGAVTVNKCIVQGRVFDRGSGNGVSGALVRLTNVDTREERTYTTTSDGVYAFDLEPETDYVLYATKQYYFTESKSISTKGRDCSDPLQKDLALDIEMQNITPDRGPINSGQVGDVIDLTNSGPIFIDDGVVRPGLPTLYHIYYDFDESYIRDDAKPELDKVVEFMYNNPGITLELGSHTDSRGSKAYNQALSQRRAQAAYDYLVSRGANPNKMTKKGYGESQLTNQCSDGVSCSDDEHQENRRTQFKITGYDPNIPSTSVPRYFGPSNPHIGKNYYVNGYGVGGTVTGYNSSNTNTYGISSGTSTQYSDGGTTYYDTTPSYGVSSGTTTTYGISSGTTTTPSSTGTTYYDTTPSYGNTTTSGTTYGISDATTTSTYTNSASTTGGSEYRIQIGAFRSPDLEAYRSLQSFGLVTSEPTGSGVERVMIGSFTDRASADNALLQIQQQGFRDAYVVQYQNGLRIGR